MKRKIFSAILPVLTMEISSPCCWMASLCESVSTDKIMQCDGKVKNVWHYFVGHALQRFFTIQLEKIFLIVENNLNVSFQTWIENYFSIYRLYIAGCEPAVNNLYPPIEYPVSRGTPSISSYCTWFHGDKDVVTPHLNRPQVFHIL